MKKIHLMASSSDGLKIVFIQQIRNYAFKLVGPCQDFQIASVARRLGILKTEILIDLNELPQDELVMLSLYLRKQLF